MDFLFKVHKVFDLAYNPKLKAFMYFFEHYIFGHAGAKRFVPQKYEFIGRKIIEIISTDNSVDVNDEATPDAIDM